MNIGVHWVDKVLARICLAGCPILGIPIAEGVELGSTPPQLMHFLHLFSGQGFLDYWQLVQILHQLRY
ncbi:hypothetical protein AGR1B_Cc110141 [Agrobacterium fabacearum S56]|nr:hypothetical protein AGR1B_Cc110141 [Agrobacterium fabacearum S56]